MRENAWEIPGLFWSGGIFSTASENAEAWPEEDAKTQRLPCWKFYLFIYFFLVDNLQALQWKKKKDFCWSIIIGIFNEWCQQNPSRDALLHKYCVAVWKEESGAVGGEARRARAGERILIWAARSLLKKLTLKEAQRKYPFTENVTGERRSNCEPVQCFAGRESAVQTASPSRQDGKWGKQGWWDESIDVLALQQIPSSGYWNIQSLPLGFFSFFFSREDETKWKPTLLAAAAAAAAVVK